LKSTGWDGASGFPGGKPVSWYSLFTSIWACDWFWPVIWELLWRLVGDGLRVHGVTKLWEQLSHGSFSGKKVGYYLKAEGVLAAKKISIVWWHVRGLWPHSSAEGFWKMIWGKELTFSYLLLDNLLLNFLVHRFPPCTMVFSISNKFCSL
jgi:hypothetical protein